jgi:hypothetical protein
MSNDRQQTKKEERNEEDPRTKEKQRRRSRHGHRRWQQRRRRSSSCRKGVRYRYILKNEVKIPESELIRVVVTKIRLSLVKEYLGI